MITNDNAYPSMEEAQKVADRCALFSGLDMYIIKVYGREYYAVTGDYLKEKEPKRRTYYGIIRTKDGNFFNSFANLYGGVQNGSKIKRKKAGQGNKLRIVTGVSTLGTIDNSRWVQEVCKHYQGDEY